MNNLELYLKELRLQDMSMEEVAFLGATLEKQLFIAEDCCTKDGISYVLEYVQKYAREKYLDRVDEFTHLVSGAF